MKDLQTFNFIYIMKCRDNFIQQFSVNSEFDAAQPQFTLLENA